MTSLTRFFLLTLSLLLGVGCRSDRYSIGSTLAAEQQAEIEVFGHRPRILVENEGPGSLGVLFRGAGEEFGPSVLHPGAATMQTLFGPVKVRLIAVEGGGCDYQLTAHGCEGLAANLLDESPVELHFEEAQ